MQAFLASLYFFNESGVGFPLKRGVPGYRRAIEHVTVHNNYVGLVVFARLDKRPVGRRRLTRPIMTVGAYENHAVLNRRNLSGGILLLRLGCRSRG